VKDGAKDHITREPEQVRAFRDTWRDGIHSYLTYLRDRLTVARELLTPSGSCFVQIGDENVHLVRSILDEVYGAEHFVSQIIFRKTTGKGGTLLDNTYDLILWYARDIKQMKYRPTYESRTIRDDSNLRYVELASGERRAMSRDESLEIVPLPTGAKAFRPMFERLLPRDAVPMMGRVMLLVALMCAAAALLAPGASAHSNGVWYTPRMYGNPQWSRDADTDNDGWYSFRPREQDASVPRLDDPLVQQPEEAPRSRS
jgi:hypothetical protein